MLIVTQSLNRFKIYRLPTDIHGIRLSEKATKKRCGRGIHTQISHIYADIFVDA